MKMRLVLVGRSVSDSISSLFRVVEELALLAKILAPSLQIRRLLRPVPSSFKVLSSEKIHFVESKIGY
jgi:hypothetical protein